MKCECPNAKRPLCSRPWIEQRTSSMPAEASLLRAVAKWWASGLQSNLRASRDRAARRHRALHRSGQSSTAAAFALHLIERAELLADFPELGTAYRKRKNVRRLRCDPYFIY